MEMEKAREQMEDPTKNKDLKLKKPVLQYPKLAVGDTIRVQGIELVVTRFGHDYIRVEPIGYKMRKKGFRQRPGLDTNSNLPPDPVREFLTDKQIQAEKLTESDIRVETLENEQDVADVETIK